MKNSIIIRGLILATVSVFSCSKTEQTSSSEPQKISLSDSVTAKPQIQPDNQRAITEKIAHYIANDYLTPADLKSIGMNDRKFRYNTIDLNDEGKMEVFVSFSTPYFCGTGGCSMILLNDHLQPITKFTVIRPPIYVDSEMKNGWKILYLQDGDQWKALTYKNGKYPSNPSIVSQTSEKPSDKVIVIFPNNNAKDYTF
ncbi:hypothetical protein [Epilithonimonas zeae]|uniref:hypothetical protein n=1 Tax=Epilithonimonas zeae TaxID=1416779 RepID=UPI00200F1E94|nr:hypothetical protein [Epilithonimonas zeae]UQB68815.1 hypothetical protein KI430_17705 [Epilithonimonas zeae]